MKILLQLLLLMIASSLYSLDIEQLDRFANEALKQTEVPGAAVAVIQDDKIVLLKGYGTRELGKEAPVDARTLFQLASVTKTFTGAAVGLLVDQKLLAWDQEVIRTFPTFSLSDIYATRYCNPKDLLAHRSGLPAFRGDLLGKLGYSDEEVVQRIREIPFDGSFREKAQYSNVAFFLAGELCAQAAKKPFTEILTSGFFNPMGMKRTGFSALLQDPNTASAHAQLQGKIQVIPHDSKDTFIADGGVVSCVEDAALWVRMLLNQGKLGNQQILSRETVKELFSPAMVASASFSEAPPINHSPYFSYSLGWENYQYKNQLVIEKGGALDGVRTVITLLPELNCGIVVFCNLNLSLYPEKVRTKFLELAVGKSDKDLQAEIDDQAKAISTMVSEPKRPENALPIAHPLEAFTGRFTSPIYGKITIEKTGDHLSLFAGPAGFQGTLTPYSNDTFLLSWPLVNFGFQEITFTFDPEGEASAITTETLGNFQRIKK
jgi:CubicO group peptidase (beta-lactamase class C family)